MNIRHALPKVIAIAAIVMLAAATACFATVLSVTQHNQEKDQWCWDASSQMVLEYYGHSYSQTAIASWAVGGRNIANYLYGSTDSSMRGCDEILSHFGSISSSGLAYAMSLATLTSEISAGRPVVLRWGWDSGGGHIAVIHGTDGNTVYVRDPWPANGPQIQSYAWVCRPYGNSGTWTHTLKLNTNVSNPYYAYYQQYLSYAYSYLNRYNSTRSSIDLYYTYYYYAYAMAYYYLSYGQTATAASYYYRYLCQANGVLANYYYSLYYYYGSHYYAAYCCYYLAYNYYYYYMYYGNSSSANYYYNYYMAWAYRYYYY